MIAPTWFRTIMPSPTPMPPQSAVPTIVPIVSST